MTKAKAGYVDGFILLVPKKNFAAYKKMAREGAKIWKKYGALDYQECIIDDAKPKHVVRTFAKMTGAKPNEAIWFSFITYKSRKHRDQVNAKMMSDPSMQTANYTMPFDMKRMSFAGFKTVVGF